MLCEDRCTIRATGRWLWPTEIASTEVIEKFHNIELRISYLRLGSKWRSFRNVVSWIALMIELPGNAVLTWARYSLLKTTNIGVLIVIINYAFLAS